MKIKSGLMILLLCVFTWVGQSPVWASVSHAKEFTVQNPYMAPATPINFRLELSDAQMAMPPEMLADLNAMIASPPNIDPSIWGKNGLNDFVMTTGVVSLSLYYAMLVFVAITILSGSHL